MGKKILIIDDDQIIRDSLQELFTDAGYVVHLAADGISPTSALFLRAGLFFVVGGIRNRVLMRILV